MKNFHHIILVSVFSFCLLLLLAACGPSVSSQTNVQPTPTVDKSFQSQRTPIPTVPPYRCAAWSSNNAPGAFSTINIYARLTRNIAPVSGAAATAVVHFQTFDQPLQAQTPSHGGGNVSFTLQLQGHERTQIPATVD